MSFTSNLLRKQRDARNGVSFLWMRMWQVRLLLLSELFYDLVFLQPAPES